MIAGMTPLLRDGRFVFCTTADPQAVQAALPLALGLFREDEGTTLLLGEDDARRLGFDCALPMARIVLEVFSALDGVGLTAAVASALARAGIACNMVAAFHHDHVFVPADRAREALQVLEDLQRQARAGDAPASG